MWRASLVSLCALLPGAALVSPPLPHGAYVWQRARGEAVEDAVARAPGELTSLVWLAAELDPRARPPVRLMSLGLARRSGRPVGLAVRVHELPRAAFDASAPPRELLDAVDAVLERARAERVSPTELQLDLDCPTRALGAYAAWARAIAARAGELPVTVTALPAWLGAPGFDRLARASAGFVLQVHSLSLPSARGARATLFDAAAAKAAVARAAALGVPFRVALPTHGYALRYDDSGRLADVLAEEGDAADARELAADPAAVAGFVRWLERRRPREAVGAVWFRLPTRDDSRSVTQDGLRSLMAGEAPHARLRARARRDADGALAIELTNEGEVPARAARVEVALAALLDFDAASSRATSARDRVVFETGGLAPHATRSLGWVRSRDARAVAEVTIDAP